MVNERPGNPALPPHHPFLHPSRSRWARVADYAVLGFGVGVLVIALRAAGVNSGMARVDLDSICRLISDLDTLAIAWQAVVGNMTISDIFPF